MPSAYPGGIDSFTTKNPTDDLATVDHAASHNGLQDAIVAIETELGTNPSAGEATVAAAIAANTAKVSNATHTGDVTGATALTIAAGVIDTPKLAAPLAAEIAANTAKVSNATHTGDVTGATALTIATDAVTNAKLANMATQTFKARTTAGTGDPEDLTATQATALLNTVTSTDKGLAPASGGGTTNFLRADSTWAEPPGGGGDSVNSLGAQMPPLSGYAYAAWSEGQGSSANIQLNRLHFEPWLAPFSATLSGIIIKVNASVVSSKVIYGLYANDAATNRPTGAALAQTADTTLSTNGVKNLAFTSAIAVTKGTWYWFAVVMDTTQNGTNNWTSTREVPGTSAGHPSYPYSTPTSYNIQGGTRMAHTYGPLPTVGTLVEDFGWIFPWLGVVVQ